MSGNIDEGLRRKLQHVSHHSKVHVQLLEHPRGLIVLERTQLKHRHATLFGRQAQWVSLVARFLRGTEYAGDCRAARKECLEYALAESLLSDDGDAHGDLVCWANDSHYRSGDPRCKLPQLAR